MFGKNANKTAKKGCDHCSSKNSNSKTRVEAANESSSSSSRTSKSVTKNCK